MRLVITTEARYLRTPDGLVWSHTAPAGRFWQAYRSTFDRVRVVARVLDVEVVDEGALRVDGDGVEVWPLPHYRGPQQYLARRRALGRALRLAAEPTDAVILRVPSAIGSVLARVRQRQGLPFALEVVGDPHGVLAPGVVRHPLRPLLRVASVAALRSLCRRACAVAYVTQRTLQARYPAGAPERTAAFTSVELGPEAFVTTPRPRSDLGPHGRLLVSVGSLEQMYKGIDTLVEALARLRLEFPVRFIHMGDGRYRATLERRCAELGLADRVSFVGAVAPGAGVRSYLDVADLFVLPSRTEGLPRAVIEAMARGLPAIGSTAGGIPELLAPEYLVPPDDPDALAIAIEQLLTDPARLAACSRHNLARAHDFALATVAPRRAAWYAELRQSTERAAMTQAGVRWCTGDRPDHSVVGRLEVERSPRTVTRVVHVIGTLDRGGAETRALDLCREVAGPALHQTFLTLGGREGSLADQFRAAGAAVTQCPLAPRRTFLLRLSRCLRAQRPDAVVSHVSLVSGVVLLAALLAGVGVRVASLRSEGDGRKSTVARRAQRGVLRRMLRFVATDVVGVTAAALAFAGPRRGDPRYRVLYNGIDVGRLRGPGRAAARTALGLPGQSPVLLHIGRAAPEKNRGFLVELHRAALVLDPRTRLVVVGPGGHADLAQVDPGVVANPNVLLLGERDDIGTVLAAADVLVLPSVREGLPGVVLEALACGVPVVATALPGLREVQHHLPGLHLLALSDGPHRWASLALKLCTSPVASRDHVRQAFQSSPFVLERAAREWEQLWSRH